MQVRINKHRFKVRSSEFEPFWRDMEVGRWEPQLLKMIGRLVKPGDTVLDLGGWIGAIALYCAASGAKVLSLEPDPAAYDILLKNVNENPLLQKSISCLNSALTPEDETVKLHARKNYGHSSSSTLIRARDTLHNKNANGISLKTLVSQQRLTKIDFIKMDIEGGEFSLLPSIKDELEKLDHPTMHVSFHLDYLSEHLYLNKFRSGWLAKAFIKAEEMSGRSFMQKEKEEIVENCLHALSPYQYIYSETGQIVYIADLLKKPLSVKNSSFLFSKRPLDLL